MTTNLPASREEQPRRTRSRGTRHPPHPPLLLSTLVDGRGTLDRTRRPVSPELTDEGGGAPGSRRDSLASRRPDTSTLSAKAFTLRSRSLYRMKLLPMSDFISSISTRRAALPTLPLEVLLLQGANQKTTRLILVKKDMKASHLCRRPPPRSQEIPPTEQHTGSALSFLIVPRFHPDLSKYLFQEGAQGRNLCRTQTPSGEPRVLRP